MLDVIDGFATTAELIDDVQSELGIDHYTARTQIMRVLDVFDSAGLLQSSAPPTWSWADAESLLPEPNW